MQKVARTRQPTQPIFLILKNFECLKIKWKTWSCCGKICQIWGCVSFFCCDSRDVTWSSRGKTPKRRSQCLWVKIHLEIHCHHRAAFHPLSLRLATTRTMQQTPFWFLTRSELIDSKCLGCSRVFGGIVPNPVENENLKIEHAKKTFGTASKKAAKLIKSMAYDRHLATSQRIDVAIAC